MKRHAAFLILATSLASLIAPKALSHCQIPCGIFDDPARFGLMAEHITTIEKSIEMIATLSAQEPRDYNQIVRWVQNKDVHADELSEIVTHYFMAQRVKLPAQASQEARAKYVEQLTTLHRLLVYAMKAKQSTDLGNVEELRESLRAFEASYLAKQ